MMRRSVNTITTKSRGKPCGRCRSLTKVHSCIAAPCPLAEFIIKLDAKKKMREYTDGICIILRIPLLIETPPPKDVAMELVSALFREVGMEPNWTQDQAFTAAQRTNDPRWRWLKISAKRKAFNVPLMLRFIC